MKEDKLIEYICQKLTKQKEIINSRCMIVGIEGQGCSGKSTFSKKLMSAINSKGHNAGIVSIDDFCNKRAVRYSGEFIPPKQHYYRNFDYERFESLVLKEVKTSGSLVLKEHVLNPATDEYDKKLEIALDHTGILLVEGVFIYKNEFKKYYDYSILLCVSPEEQLNRALQRDIVKNGSKEVLMDKYLNRYIPAYKLYEEFNKPLEYADIVIDNSNAEAPIIIRETI